MSAAGTPPAVPPVPSSHPPDQPVITSLTSSPVQVSKRSKTMDTGFSGGEAMHVEVLTQAAAAVAGETRAAEIENQTGPITSTTGGSYLDKVLGRQSHVDSEMIEEEEPEPIDSDGEGEPDCPKISFPKGFHGRRSARWKRALVVRVLGHSFPFLFLQRRLLSMWARTGPITVAAMGRGFYSVRFTTEQDFERALTEGPWMIEDHYVLTRVWTRGFEPEDEELSKTLVWARLPKLPMDYYDEELIANVGNSVGRFVKIDEATRQATRGHFARMCVEVDLSRPLICKYKLERRTRRIEYEGLHKVCFTCGRYGHTDDICPKKEMESPSEEAFRTAHIPKSKTTIEQERPEIFEDYGPWMIASSNRRRRPTGAKDVSQKPTQRPVQGKTNPAGSRFDVLNSLNDELREHQENLAKERGTEGGGADTVMSGNDNNAATQESDRPNSGPSQPLREAKSKQVWVPTQQRKDGDGRDYVLLTKENTVTRTNVMPTSQHQFHHGNNGEVARSEDKLAASASQANVTSTSGPFPVEADQTTAMLIPSQQTGRPPDNKQPVARSLDLNRDALLSGENASMNGSTCGSASENVNELTTSIMDVEQRD
ncbi:unnamed protein product [Linum trigynum]|uniref:CCHC-type domain-containing protein n=1 Tax=Linum trigynum TaxID=586398 RepID=A0AAV2CJG9_9ROSI